jgi:hypothetical protein
MDRESRHLAHYFDHDTYQEQVNKAGGTLNMRSKASKRDIERFKKKKQEKKQKRILQWMDSNDTT